MAVSRINFVMDDKERKQMEETADQLGWSISLFIREAIREKVKKEKRRKK